MARCHAVQCQIHWREIAVENTRLLISRKPSRDGESQPIVYEGSVATPGCRICAQSIIFDDGSIGYTLELKSDKGFRFEYDALANALKATPPTLDCQVDNPTVVTG